MTNDKTKKPFHDIKNTIVSIKMGIDMLKEKTKDGHNDNEKLIQQIDEAISKLNGKWGEIKSIIN